jgi:hypothetical protein
MPPAMRPGLQSGRWVNGMAVQSRGAPTVLAPPVRVLAKAFLSPRNKGGRLSSPRISSTARRAKRQNPCLLGELGRPPCLLGDKNAFAHTRTSAGNPAPGRLAKAGSWKPGIHVAQDNLGARQSGRKTIWAQDNLGTRQAPQAARHSRGGPTIRPAIGRCQDPSRAGRRRRTT